ncbi:MAG: TolC family protein, partial [Burkholderiales bacterium]|nr:TolC family protein [Burkholderiales bacterium]
SRSEARGAQFSAPGLGTSAGVGFDTSVNNGTATRWAITASMPLYDPQRRAQQAQLMLSADMADLGWTQARQDAMLNTARRYYDLALAAETLRVLEGQQAAVARAATEAEDRFKLGAVPITDSQEARARLAAIRAQVLAARTDLEIKRSVLADSTGLAPESLTAQLPAAGVPDAPARSLQDWLAEADAANVGLKMRRLAATIAAREASKFSLSASPTVELVAQAGRDRLSGHGDFGPAGNTATNSLIGVQVSIPLYTGGYRDARQEQALRRVDQAQDEIALARQQVAQGVRTAWRGLSVGGERVAALVEGVQASQARRDATELGQQVGDRTTQDLLNAENDLAAARLALAQARVALWLDRLQLAALTGTGEEAELRAADAALTSGS